MGDLILRPVFFGMSLGILAALEAEARSAGQN
jgi:hypothetical protein